MIPVSEIGSYVLTDHVVLIAFQCNGWLEAETGVNPNLTQGDKDTKEITMHEGFIIITPVGHWNIETFPVNWPKLSF